MLFQIPRRYWEMSSIEETKAHQIATNTPDKFIQFNKRNLVRVYPKGTRLLSSNFDPLPMWLMGCQMVALNYQAGDRELMFNRAMFRQNGRCGYILKPSFLRGAENRKIAVAKCSVLDLVRSFADGKFSPDSEPRRLRIKIVSGQHLPKSEQRIKGDIIEPYVKVRVRGCPQDEDEYVTKVVPKVVKAPPIKKKTPAQSSRNLVFSQNGFNPIWNEAAVFDVHHPDLAFVEFKVKSQEGTAQLDEHLGSYVIPFHLMRSGYR